MAMETQIPLQVNRKTFDFARKTEMRINHLYGSAGSGKSWGLGQHLFVNKFLMEHDVRMVMTRTTGPALKKSQWLLLNDLRQLYGVPARINKADFTMSYNSNTIFFVPLDDVEKFKSFERINYIWVEEATDLTRDQYLQLNLRCRGENPNGMNQLFFSYNPIDENSFLKEIVDSPPENTAVNHSTFHDNRFLEQDYIDEIERLKEQDIVYWKIYGEGIWASPENIIYTNWDIVDEWPEDDWFDEVIYGVDFGFNNQTAIMEMGIKDDEVWERELLYETGLTNADLIEQMEEIGLDKERCMYADSSEPARIEEISRAGFNIYPAVKGNNSVQNGIDYVKRRHRHVHKDSVNAIKEDRGYKWREDRNGNILDEPVKFRDHLKDAERYGLYTHFYDIGSFRVVC